MYLVPIILRKKKHNHTFNWASAEWVPEAALLVAESPQWFCPPGPDAVNILAAAKV